MKCFSMFNNEVSAMFERYCLAEETFYLFINAEMVKYGQSAFIKFDYFFLLRSYPSYISPDIFGQRWFINMNTVECNIKNIPEDCRSSVHLPDEQLWRFYILSYSCESRFPFLD